MNNSYELIIYIGAVLTIVGALICLYQAKPSIEKIEVQNVTGEKREIQEEIISISNEIGTISSIISKYVGLENLPFLQFLAFSCSLRIYLGYLKGIFFWPDRPLTTPTPGTQSNSRLRIWRG